MVVIANMILLTQERKGVGDITDNNVVGEKRFTLKEN